MCKDCKRLKKLLNRALDLLNEACGWASEVIGKEGDSPTMEYVMKRAEEFNREC